MAGRDTVALACFLVLLGASNSQDITTPSDTNHQENEGNFAFNQPNSGPPTTPTTVPGPVGYSDLIAYPDNQNCLSRIVPIPTNSVDNDTYYGRNSEPLGSLYPNDFHCSLKIEAPRNAFVEFYFRKLQIEDSLECEKDKVRLYTSTDSINYESIADFCGIHHRNTGPCFGNKTRAPTVQTGTRYMMLILNTDGDGQDRGYQIKYKAISGPSVRNVSCDSSCTYRCQMPPIIRPTTTGPTTTTAPTTTTPPTTTTSNVPFALDALEDNCGIVPSEAGSDTQFTVGGSSITWSDLPWTVALYKFVDGVIMYRCGATVIDAMWVVTAAHCVTFPTTYYIKAATTTLAPSYSSSDLIEVVEVISHPDFDAIVVDNNIALLKLASPFPSTSVAACLRAEEAPVGQLSCVVSGWGRTAENIQAANLSIWTNTDCMSSNTANTSSFTMTNNMLCASGPQQTGPRLTGECFLDNGAPLTCESDGKVYLDGLATRGQECGGRGLPSIFTRTSPYFNWIVAATVERAATPIDTVVSIVLPADCGMRPPIARIIGGGDAIPHSWPWQVSLMYKGSHLCGGSIIHESWIITAAHCLLNKTTNPSVVLVDFQVRVGAKNKSVGIVINVVKCKIYPYYNAMTGDNDIALLKLDVPLNFSDPHIQPICLTTRDFPEWTTCTVTGWGVTFYPVPGGDVIERPDLLQELNVHIRDNGQCHKAYGGGITPRMVCMGGLAVGMGACKGDSGGPLACPRGQGQDRRWYLQGVASFVSGRGCAKGVPDVCARVTKFIRWLLDIIIDH